MQKCKSCHILIADNFSPSCPFLVFSLASHGTIGWPYIVHLRCASSISLRLVTAPSVLYTPPIHPLYSPYTPPILRESLPLSQDFVFCFLLKSRSCNWAAWQQQQQPTSQCNIQNRSLQNLATEAKNHGVHLWCASLLSLWLVTAQWATYQNFSQILFLTVFCNNLAPHYRVHYTQTMPLNLSQIGILNT